MNDEGWYRRSLGDRRDSTRYCHRHTGERWAKKEEQKDMVNARRPHTQMIKKNVGERNREGSDDKENILYIRVFFFKFRY